MADNFRHAQYRADGTQIDDPQKLKDLSEEENNALIDVAFGARNNRSILVIGGDHPYSQWWGNDGTDGMAQMYFDLKISPYIAICADENPNDLTSGYGATLGKPSMMSLAQARQLYSRGAEFISHATRHNHFWELLNTGIRVWYSGAESTPTVNISTTQLTTNTATTGATAFLFSTYTTLASLRTAIRSLSGWNCELASELLGTEPSTSLMPLNAARSNTPSADPTNSCQRFAICGGLLLRYTGSAYKDVSISVNDGSNFLSIFCDGARVLAQSTAATLTTIATNINALAISGLYALVMDNGYAAQSVAGSTALNPGQKIRETYCFGDELGTGLHRVAQAQSINFTGMNVCGGMGYAYAFRRTVLAVKERAISLYGFPITSYAQPGGRLSAWMIRSAADEHVSWRGNRSFTETINGLSPHAMPANLGGKFQGHFTSIVSSSSSLPYSESDVKAVLDALADTEGWLVNWLNHLCTPTPNDPSPYEGMNQHSTSLYTSSADQDEGPFYRELKYAAALRDAGGFDILPPTRAERIRKTQKVGPTNLIFNPKFRNGRSDNLLGVVTTAQGGASGVACPGWAITGSSSDYSEFSISNGEITLTTNGALGANRTPIGSNVFLTPGKTYEIGAALNLLSRGSSNTVRWIIYALHNGMGDAFILGQTSMSSQPFYGNTNVDANFTFTVPPRGNPAPAKAIGIAGPFSFTAGDAIVIQIDNRTASAAIVLTGLTTAKTVAAAINSAIAADATYVSLAQYHNIARAEDNRLIVEAPLVNSGPNDSGSLLTIANSVGTPLAVLFGTGITAVRATSKSSDPMDTTMVGYRLALLPSTTSGTQTLKLTAPYCREVQL